MGKLATSATQSAFVIPDAGSTIDVRIDGESVWLSSEQMAQLFGREVSVVRRHVRNVFKDGEVPEESSYRQNLPVTSPTGGRPEPIYNLDVIISVGYRVKSPHGIAFRQWATRVLRSHLVEQYRNRSSEAGQVLAGMKSIAILANTTKLHQSVDSKAVLDLIERYAKSWSILLQYDEKKLPLRGAASSSRLRRLTEKQAESAINTFKAALASRGQATELFGVERGVGTLSGILKGLEQTWSGKSIYPTAEIRAAHLLYFVIKNHPFVDGNKRIASLLFLHYMEKNGVSLPDENTVVALALLIAESDPREKDIVIRLTQSLIQDAAHGVDDDHPDL